MINRSLFVVFCFLNSIFLQAEARSDQEKIRVLAQPFPPFSIQLPKGQATGLGVEIYRIIAEEIGLGRDDYEVRPVTFKRMYVEVQNAPRRVGVAMSRIPQRERLFRWVGPYTQITSGLIAKKSRNIKIKKFEDISNYMVASINNTAPEQALIRRGLSPENLESTFKPQLNLFKLELDRVDMMAQPVQSISFIMWQNGIKADDYELVYKIHSPALYFVFSKDFSQGEIDRFEEALNKFMLTKAYLELVKVYRLNDIEIPIKN